MESQMVQNSMSNISFTFNKHNHIQDNNFIKFNKCDHIQPNKFNQLQEKWKYDHNQPKKFEQIQQVPITVKQQIQLNSENV